MKAHFLTKIFLIFGVCISWHGCTCNKTKIIADNDSTKLAINVNVPDFNADSAYNYTAKQVSFGPRIPGTKAQEQCAEWLIAKMKLYTSTVIVQTDKVKIYDGTLVPMKNIIASFNPEKQKRLLFFVHWDTRPFADRDSANRDKTFEGADDAASGVGTLIEIARQLSRQTTSCGIDILFEDVEDYGPPSYESQWDEKDTYCLGTQYWCRNPHDKNYKAYYGVLLDMSGAKDARFLMEGISMQFAPTVVKKIWDIAHQLGYGQYFPYETANPIIDDHYYINTINGTPSVDIIYLDKNSSTGFAPHWHTQSDNMKIIDRATLKVVGQTLLQLIYNEPAEDL